MPAPPLPLDIATCRNRAFTGLAYHGVMRDVSASFRVRTALLVLESTAARAGCAMACAFGSSAEFEAAVIRRKLEARANGRKRRWRYIIAAVVTASLLTALVYAL